ncbi:MAG: transposase zinc-binding domain-containing protein, partial [Syntrophales bacterium]|nr:transposase zinc-binding domain-containing protein [Syntrophales bacterium]
MIMHIASILDQYHDAFQAKYGSRLLPSHLYAIAAISRCRTPQAGQMLVQCTDCGYTTWRPRSCGHRNCPQCQNHETSLWLDRQHDKLLPVEYFMVTFTLPYEMRLLAWDNQNRIYDLLFACASSTLKDFGLNPKNLGADIGMTAVLHTH